MAPRVVKLSGPDLATFKSVARQAARRAGAQGAVTFEPGIRYSLSRADLAPSFNVRLVDTSENWEDSDLCDFAQWSDFAAGIPLCPEGRACVDFYLSGADSGLACNVQAHIRDGRGLVLVTTDGPQGDVTLWQSDKGGN